MPLIDTAFEAWLPRNGVQSVKTYLDSLGYVETLFLEGRALRNAVPPRTEELHARIQAHPNLDVKRKSDLTSALHKYDAYQRERRGLPPREK